MYSQRMMNRLLHRKIETYCAWYKLVRSWTLFQQVLFFGCSAMALYVLCDKLVYLGMAYSAIALAVGMLGLLILLLFYVFSPRTRGTVGYLVDKSAGLKNLVSSGLSVIEEPDEVSTVVVGRAGAALMRQSPAKLLPFKLNWAGRFTYIPVILLLVSLLIPNQDLIGRKRRRNEIAVEQALVQKGALKLAAKLTSIQGKSEPLQSIEGNKITKDFNALATNLMGVAKKEALLKLGEFENKYRDEFSEQRNFEQAARGLQTQPDMQGVAPETQEQLKELMKNLTGGNFKDAGEALRELANQLKGNDLSAEQKQALAREMRKITEQMQGEGCSEELAKLLRDIEAAPEDLESLLKQCQRAGREMEELAKFCDESDGLKAMREGLAEAKQEMLGESFSDFDATEVEQYLEGEASLGGKGAGPGTGGEGMGRGGQPLENMTETTFKSKMSPSKINKGKILHQLFISGVPEKGEAFTEYVDVVRAAKEHAAGSLARDRIPREYEDMVKTYFDSLDLEKPNEDQAP